MPARSIVLILLLSYPAGLRAQVVENARHSESSAAATSVAPTPLSPRNSANRTEVGQRPNGPPPLVTIAGSLALVLGVFFLVAWALRWASPRGMRTLPGEVLEMLGRVRLDSRQQAHLLRLGNKLLLVSVSAAGAETLTEITDPFEVDRLAGLCRQRRSGLPPDVSAREGEP
jgi:flagellar biogenesis protein FliO